MAQTKREDVMGVVSREWLYRQTMADGYSNHWIDLVEDVLALKRSTKAVLHGGQWLYPSHAVKTVLAVPPRDLEEILESRK